MLDDFITSLVEYQQFGWNTTTITSAVIVGLSLFQAWGTWLQNRRIWQSKSGEGLSVRWFAYTMAFFVAAIIYGVYARSGAMLINATTLALLHLMVLVGLWRFKQWTFQERWQVTAFVGIPIVVALAPVTVLGSMGMPAKDVAFMVFSFGTIYAVATQPWEMWRKKTAGIVEVRLISVHLVAVSFWAVYAFYIDALALMIMNPILFVLFATTIALWVVYPKQQVATA